MTIGAGATGFSAYGITFQDDYNVVDHTAAGEQTPAVALNTQADKVYLKNSRIIGRQDTLYVQGRRQPRVRGRRLHRRHG